MKKLLPLVILIGCLNVKPVEAPIIIDVEGNSGAKPILVVSDPEPVRQVIWDIEIHNYRTHESWAINLTSLETETVVVDSETWKCIARRFTPVSYFDMISIHCINNLIFTVVNTRGVGCDKYTRDSVNVERDGFAIYIVCDSLKN